MKKLVLGLMLCSGILMAEFAREDAVGVVSDVESGLMWQDDVKQSLAWQEAIDYCEALRLGTYDDWRLPNKEELRSIVGKVRYRPASDPAFKTVASEGYWTTTPREEDTDYAWMVDFEDGTDIFGYKTRSHFVRCVRGGK